MTTGPRHNVTLGITGTLVLVATVLGALNLDKLPLVAGDDVIHVELAEAGGLKSGDAVLVSGARVGKVRSLELEDGLVVADIAITDGDLRLGDTTSARVVTMTLLGRAGISLEPAGSGDLADGATIPIERTSAPYNLTSTLNQLSDTSGKIDKAQLAHALEEVAGTFSASSEEIGPALEGITSLASAISVNDDELRSLVDRAARVSGVLASRDEQIASLLGSGESLLGELQARRDVIVRLLDDARSLSTQLKALMEETGTVLGPALTELDRLVDLLNENKANLQASITGLQGYATAFGEAVATGPWFDAYIQNLTAPASLAPVLSGVTQ